MSTTPWVCPNGADHFVNTTMFGWPICSECRQAPPYHERFAYLPDNFALAVYVPAGAIGMITPASAIVGLPNGGDGEDDWTEVHFEGWVNGPMQYADRDARGLWEAGVLHAAGRLVTDYPTSARMSIQSTKLDQIGIYFPKRDEIQIDSEILLTEWLEIQ